MSIGQNIIPDKSCIFLIAFEFDKIGKWRYMINLETGQIFSVKDNNGIRQNLLARERHISACTLRVFLAPDGNNRNMFEHFQHKAD